MLCSTRECLIAVLVQGILMATPGRIVRREALARLWAHESLRVFHDRLVSAEDKALLRGLLSAAAASHLPGLLQPVELSGARPLLFGDFHNPSIPKDERVYEEARPLPPDADALWWGAAPDCVRHSA
jgi:dynein heavy chain